MLIRFTGPAHVRRIIGPYEWAEHNDFVQDVPADVAADLLTSPENRFIVECEWEPLAHTAPVPVTDVVFAALALAGVGHVIDLATLTDEGLTHVSLSANVDPALIEEWASRARSYLFSDEEE